MSKKTRGPNFTSNEKEVLVHLVTKYKEVVENKKTDAVTIATKNDGWKMLTEEFNAISSFSVRNTEQLKTCWENIKRNTRKDKAKTKKETFLTGGGRPNFPPPGSLQSQVEVLLGPTLSGLENPFDSDAQYSERDRATTLNVLTEIEPPASPATISDELSKVAQENEATANPSAIPITRDDCLMIIPENEATANPSAIPKTRDDCLFIIPEDNGKKMWNGWSPAALKSNVSDALTVNKENSRSWVKRRRPKASLHDKFLESKLELIELMKKNVESEANIKNRILEEQLKQEKLKTKALELQLNLSEENN